MAPYDPVKAGEILDEAGWVLADDGFRYRARREAGYQYHLHRLFRLGLVNEIYQQALTEIGVDAPVKTAEWNAMLDEWRENQGNWTAGHHSQGWFFSVTSAHRGSLEAQRFLDHLPD